MNLFNYKNTTVKNKTSLVKISCKCNNMFGPLHVICPICVIKFQNYKSWVIVSEGIFSQVTTHGRTLLITPPVTWWIGPIWFCHKGVLVQKQEYRHLFLQNNDWNWSCKRVFDFCSFRLIQRQSYILLLKSLLVVASL